MFILRKYAQTLACLYVSMDVDTKIDLVIDTFTQHSLDAIILELFIALPHALNSITDDNQS